MSTGTSVYNIFWMMFIKFDITLLFVYQYTKHAAQQAKKRGNKLYDAAVPDI